MDKILDPDSAYFYLINELKRKGIKYPDIIKEHVFRDMIGRESWNIENLDLGIKALINLKKLSKLPIECISCIKVEHTFVSYLFKNHTPYSNHKGGVTALGCAEYFLMFIYNWDFSNYNGCDMTNGSRNYEIKGVNWKPYNPKPNLTGKGRKTKNMRGKEAANTAPFKTIVTKRKSKNTNISIKQEGECDIQKVGGVFWTKEKIKNKTVRVDLPLKNLFYVFLEYNEREKIIRVAIRNAEIVINHINDVVLKTKYYDIVEKKEYPYNVWRFTARNGGAVRFTFDQFAAILDK